MSDLRVILTHQHADFDALASLLGAWLLYPDALPVLPTLLNRDVQAFVDAFGADFPFIHHKNLPKMPSNSMVTQAIVVDTQRPSLIKGMDETTPHLIIDHHVLKEGLPEAWDVTIDMVGANATLLIERIITQGIPVTPSQATLLALGIYQDTGRLTFRGTTSRDAQAVAWLLAEERRADLQMINRFLGHPLSEEQQVLLKALVANCEFMTINQKVIAIAEGRVAGFDDELSALVSNVQQTFDADAVFLLISQIGRKPDHFVQMIARSRMDELDVGKVARHFGGNGHSRAAAAPIQDLTLSDVRLRLEATIERQMASTSSPNSDAVGLSDEVALVRHIMSVGRPRTLSSSMAVSQALTLMRRYGHEGFLVVTESAHSRNNGTLLVDDLLGLLTRRDVDRAFDHEMVDESVSRIMHRGAVTVRSGDTLLTLRQLMTETGWGQIPVCNSENEIVGIVTRTDLLRSTLETTPPHDDVTLLLARALPPAQLALLQLLGNKAEAAGYQLFVVGGFVRDMLLSNLTSVGSEMADDGEFESVSTAQATSSAADMDIVMEGDAIHFAQLLQHTFGGRVVTHKRFGTAKWFIQHTEHPVNWSALAAALGNESGSDLSKELPDHLDFVTARTEYYSAPSALPTVETGSIQLDLRRRDFTINTLAIGLNPQRWGQLLDFFGGMADLKHGWVRVLHSLSFVDDPTRMMRAVRYEQRFGFAIHERTRELFLESLTLIDRLTPVRVQHELTRIFQEAEPERILDRLDGLGILHSIHRGLHYSPQVGRYFDSVRMCHNAGGREVRSAKKLQKIVAYPALNRILYTESLTDLYWVLFLISAKPGLDEDLALRLAVPNQLQTIVADLRTMVARLPELKELSQPVSQIVQELENLSPVALALSNVIESDVVALASIENYLNKWRHVSPILNGHSLLQLGIPKGPAMRMVLLALRNQRLDGLITNQEDEERFIQEWKKKQKV